MATARRRQGARGSGAAAQVTSDGVPRRSIEALLGGTEKELVQLPLLRPFLSGVLRAGFVQGRFRSPMEWRRDCSPTAS